MGQPQTDKQHTAVKGGNDGEPKYATTDKGRNQRKRTMQKAPMLAKVKYSILCACSYTMFSHLRNR